MKKSQGSKYIRQFLRRDSAEVPPSPISSSPKTSVDKGSSSPTPRVESRIAAESARVLSKFSRLQEGAASVPAPANPSLISGIASARGITGRDGVGQHWFEVGDDQEEAKRALDVSLPPVAAIERSRIKDALAPPTKNQRSSRDEIDLSLEFAPEIEMLFDQVWVKVQRRLTQFDDGEVEQDDLGDIRHRNVQSIVVTSWSENEGSSSVALGMAARAGKGLLGRVCLVDADFHERGLTNAAGCENRIGLAQVLAGEATLDEAVINNTGADFVFLPAGIGASADGLPDDAKIQHVIQSLEQKYRYIFYDTSNIKRGVEAFRWGRFIVNAILVVRAGVNRKQTVLHAVEQLQSHGMKLLGTVLTHRQDLIPNWLYPYV